MNNQNVRLFNPATIHKPTGYTHVAEVNSGRMVFISGQVALDVNGNIVGVGDLRAQAVQVFENLKAALESVGADFSHVVKFTYYIVEKNALPIVREVRNQYINVDLPPASTAVYVSELARADFLLEIEAIAVIP
ncbi:MAG: enamine deaminase RidA [Chloroflexota bacterium]|nr:RidA family protein [Chloroflexota bacterium]NOG65304.1 RidA family protein [Chloroflexota bacterium]GIK66691.1 MAG: enamine deaminase RidA [Chloroflexota bacterium]